MVIESTKAVGSTRLRRVQFGVPPNCIGAQTICVKRMNDGAAPAESFGRDARNNPRDAGATSFFPHSPTSAIK